VLCSATKDDKGSIFKRVRPGADLKGV